MSYKHINTLACTGTSASHTFTNLPQREAWVGVQAVSGIIRVATGKGSATALVGAGLRVFPDQPPIEFPLEPGEDTIAGISEDGSSSTTLEILEANR